MKEVLAVLAIVIVSLFAVLAFSSITGNAAYNSYNTYYPHTMSKVYGGAIKKVHRNPALVSKNVQEDNYVRQIQHYMLDNKDKWDCSYGPEAENSKYPCMFNEDLGKYCCVISDAPGNFNQLGRL